MNQFDFSEHSPQIVIGLVCGLAAAVWKIVKGTDLLSAMAFGVLVGGAVFLVLYVIAENAGAQKKQDMQHLNQFIEKEQKDDREVGRSVESASAPSVTVPDTWEQAVDKKVVKVERKSKGRSIVCIPKHYTVVDTETTGLDPQKNRLIEIAAIRIRGGKEVARFETLVKPGRKLSKKITELTGITDEELKDAPTPEECLPRFLDFLNDDIIVAHNANFDVNFIYDSLNRCGLPPLKNNFVDTLRIAKYIRPDLDNYKLSTLAQEYKVAQPTAHRALADCETTAAVLQALAADADKQNIDLSQYQRGCYPALSKVSGITANPGRENPGSPFYGKRCVFTGELDSMTRREAAQLVVDVGGTCGDKISKKTSFLIVGNNEYCKGEGTKQLMAKDLIQQGVEIQILTEDCFLKMLE